MTQETMFPSLWNEITLDEYREYMERINRRLNEEVTMRQMTDQELARLRATAGYTVHTDGSVRDIREEVEMPRERVIPARTRRNVALPTVTHTPPPEIPPVPSYCAHILYGMGNMEAVLEVQTVLNEYATLLHRNIFYCNTHGEHKLPYVGPDLHVYFWSRPSREAGERDILSEAYGYSLVAGQGDWVVPTESDLEMGESIWDEAGNMVAFVAESTIYVLFDLPHTPGENTEHILREIMKAYVDLKDPKEVEMRKRASLTKAQERVPEVLQSLMTGPLAYQIERVKGNINMYQERISGHENDIRTYLSKLVGEQNALRRLETDANHGNNAQKEMDALKRIKKVTRISTNRDKLIVELDTVCLTTDVARYEIGRFAVEFGPSNYFKIKNTTGRITKSGSNYDHPHILNGEPCLGNMKDIYTYVYSGEIAMAVMTTLAFLSEYNPGSAYIAVDSWKEVENFKRPKVHPTDPTLVSTESFAIGAVRNPVPVTPDDAHAAIMGLGERLRGMAEAHAQVMDLDLDEVDIYDMEEDNADGDDQ